MKWAGFSSFGVYKSLFFILKKQCDNQHPTGGRFKETPAVQENLGKMFGNVMPLKQALFLTWSNPYSFPRVTADTWKQTSFAPNITVLIGQLHWCKPDTVHSATAMKWKILVSTEGTMEMIVCLALTRNFNILPSLCS